MNWNNNIETLIQASTVNVQIIKSELRSTRLDSDRTFYQIKNKILQYI